LTAAFAALSATGSQSAREKLAKIEQEKLPPRAVVAFTPAELNAYAAEQVRTAVGDAVRQPRLEFDAAAITGSAQVDFVKLQTSRGQPPGMILRWLLRGEKPVSVRVRLSSAKGQARVDIEEVRVSGIPLTGSALELVIDYYLRPRYPEVAIAEPFELRHKVDRLEVSPAGLKVHIRG
jgi:hypothetical protein